jgi:hypothetical protein
MQGCCVQHPAAGLLRRKRLAMCREHHHCEGDRLKQSGECRPVLSGQGDGCCLMAVISDIYHLFILFFDILNKKQETNLFFV